MVGFGIAGTKNLSKWFGEKMYVCGGLAGLVWFIARLS